MLSTPPLTATATVWIDLSRARRAARAGSAPASAGSTGGESSWDLVAGTAKA
jgi:hypothetical protein